jgi:RHS repeat-associated protein
MYMPPFGWWYLPVTQKKTTYNYDTTNGFLNSKVVDYNCSGFYGDCGESAITEYKYNAFGQLTREKSSEGVVTGKGYNYAGQIESEFVLADGGDINEPDTSLTLVSQTKYEYDADGHTKKIIRAKDGGTFTYGSPDSWIVTEYGYDFLGRRTSVIEDANGAHPLTTSYEYNNQGEVTKVTEPSGKWTKTIRDGRGLVTQRIRGYGSVDVLITSYEYDENGNLIEQTNPDGVVWNFEYDNFDRVVKAPVIQDAAVRARNTELEYQMTEAILFRQATSNTASPKPFDYVTMINRHLSYPGRTYDPALGRWRQMDPIGYADGMNAYEYVSSNPVNFVDPYGLCKCGPDITSIFYKTPIFAPLID